MNEDLKVFRAQLQRLLAHPEIASSRQLRDFLAFTSEKSFAGVGHLEQVDVASAVLGRGDDFNPLEDASVRKLASLARQRLEQYYAGAGAADEVLVTFPMRSYVPRYEKRMAEEPVKAPQAPGRRSPWLVPGLLAVAAILLGGWAIMRMPASSEAGEIVVVTKRGDIMGGKVADLPGDCVRLGPRLQDQDEITVRLRFTPEREAQQAGIIIWQDAGNYIKLGRKFYGRSQLEFDMQDGGAYRPTPRAFTFEPEAQDGQAIWLSIRRTGQLFRGFLSRDGIHWTSVGETLEPKRAFSNARAGIYAFHGRRAAPPAEARFDHFTTGPTFENWIDLDNSQESRRPDLRLKLLLA